MADPILPDHWRAQWIWHGRSGLAEDVFVNSFVFHNTGDISTSPVDQRIRDVLEDFYFGQAPGQVNNLAWYMNGNVVDDYSVKCYDLGQPKPRNPVLPVMTPSLIIGGAGGIPTEVAAVLSLRTSLRSPRGRGRLYIGPLSTRAMSESIATGPIITSAFRTDLAAAAARLMQGNEGFVAWKVLSIADSTPRTVIGGYVDDAFDTQRRRGLAPSQRTTFGTVI